MFVRGKHGLNSTRRILRVFLKNGALDFLSLHPIKRENEGIALGMRVKEQ
jgi:hypothetical protein